MTHRTPRNIVRALMLAAAVGLLASPAAARPPFPPPPPPGWPPKPPKPPKAPKAPKPPKPPPTPEERKQRVERNKKWAKDWHKKRKAWAKKRSARLEALRLKLHAKLKGKPVPKRALKELENHHRRMARLNRAKVVAAERERDNLVERIDELLRREKERHERFMAKLKAED